MNTLNVLNHGSCDDSTRAGLESMCENLCSPLPAVDLRLRGGDIIGFTGSTPTRSFPRKRESTSFHTESKAPPLPGNGENRRPSREDFAQIYEEHHPKVLRTCRRMLGSPEEAEDAANDVFVKLPNSLESYDSSQPFARWLARVASNHCIDLLRKRRSEQRVIQADNLDLPETAAPLRSPFEDLISKERSDVVRDAIFRLPERYLVPLVMRYFSDLSYNEIAKTLGISKANVGLLIFRAKQQLRSILAGCKARPRRGNRKRASGAGSLQGTGRWLGQLAAVLGAP